MKKLIYAAAALLLSLTSCSKDETLEEGSGYPEPTSGTRVSLTLKGSAEIGQSTRGNGADGTVSGKLAAKAEEKKVNSLLAVAFFHNDYTSAQGGAEGTLYKVIDVTLPADKDTSLPWFDMAFDGRFDVWFVANADTALTQKIKALNEKTDKVDAFQKLVSEQAPDTDNKFLMISTEGYDITTLTGSTTPVAVVMRRASVRVDIINRIPGVTVKQVKFINRAMHSRIATPNTQTEAPDSYTSDKTYTTELGEKGLVGYLPTGQGDESTKIAASKCEGKIYSYENLNDDTANKISTLELTYEIDGASTPEGAPISKTYTVEFKVKVGADGQLTQLQLKRNHLYRVVLNEKYSDEIVSAQIIVEDWNTAEEFKVEEMPFDPSANKNLMVNRFVHYNAKNVDLEAKTFEFNTLFDNRPEMRKMTFGEVRAMNEYFNMVDFAAANVTGGPVHAVFKSNDGQYYRLPTIGECELLSPRSNVNPIFFQKVLPSTSGIETIYLENNEKGQVKTDGKKLEGAYEFKQAAAPKTLLDGTTQVYTVYGIRFKETEQESAYRWAYCDMPESKQGDAERYISIKIKATKNLQSAEKSIEKIADEAFWADGFIEYQFPCTGFWSYQSNTLVVSGTNSYFRTSTLTENSIYNWGGTLEVCLTYLEERKNGLNYVPIRFVEATEAEYNAYKQWETKHKAEVEASKAKAVVGDFVLADGMVVKADHFTTHEADKAKAVAVVFSTDKTRISPEVKTALGGEDNVHGLAMALNESYVGKVDWKVSKTTTLPTETFPYITNSSLAYNKFNGLEAFQWIVKAHQLDQHPAFQAAKNYAYCAPANSSSWYLPSTGEWCDIIHGLGGVTLGDSWKTSTGPFTAMSNEQGVPIDKTEVVASINSHLAKAGDKDINYTEIAPNQLYSYWSSNEYSNEHGIVISFYTNNTILFSANFKSNLAEDHRVRPVLAF